MKTSDFEKEINRTGKLVYTNKGTSMMPLLREKRDLLIIKKPDGRLKKYDVPLYKRTDGRYVLHRILKVRKDEYVICGDNCWKKEYGITDRDIVGILTAFVRDGKEISVTNWKYRLYVHVWCDLFCIRALIIYTKSRIKNIMKKIIIY